jgi:hypothetical protein
MHPSKIMIRTLNLDDKVRKAVLDRKKPIIKKGAKTAKKAAPKKVAEVKAVEEAAALPQTEAETSIPEENKPKEETTSETKGGK